MIIDITVMGKGSIINGTTFVFPKDADLAADEIMSFVSANDEFAKEYDKKWQMYIGNHAILHKNAKDHGPDNKLVNNLAHYIVETFNGYFMGIPPKITLDDDTDNEKLQQWNDTNSFQDKLNEISKQADVYGRSIAFLFQNENSETGVAYSSPMNSFIIYDDSVLHEPLAFVRYTRDKNNILFGQVYTDNEWYSFDDSANRVGKVNANQFGQVPAVEFFDNEERQGVFENAMTLIDALNNVVSQKANQNAYFDNAYLLLKGMDLDGDDGKLALNLDGNQIIYAPNEESVNGTAEFLSKPDGDAMQEHLTDRLINMIYQVCMVANLNDDSFSGNSSGVALQYKLLPMKNMAANKERKFTQALRKLYKIAFGVETILDTTKTEAWQDLKFQFTRNLPVNLADEASTAKNLVGLVSQETLLSTLSFVDDAKNEINRMKEEQQEQIKRSLEATNNITDQQKVGVDDGEETE
ncbi:phage portal protein [Pediococcus pentosaceus]|uniref:phage portal protein n=1 Tax=Pediococcus pentosaceus TaxID=1255 RepID=UPI0018FE5D7D|nr:phage portal protein [Pediococcus pentosaceus]MBF7122050.1 phage portal protein [Pediococcus pentosaceus]